MSMIDSGGIAPASGYSSSAKQEYRMNVWKGMAGHVAKNTWAVIMPARGCEEIDAAIESGVPADQILCFDGSPAVIATSLWRKKYPDIKFFTSKLSDLPKKIAKTGKAVSAINMDLCGNFAGPQVDEINAFLSSGIMSNKGAFGVNIAKGREGKQILRLLEKISVGEWFDDPRMRGLMTMLDFWDCMGEIQTSITGIAQGQYRENKTPMTWAVMAYETHHEWARDDLHISTVRKAIANDDAELFYKETQKANDYYRKFESGINMPSRSYLHTYAKTMAMILPTPSEKILNYSV